MRIGYRTLDIEIETVVPGAALQRAALDFQKINLAVRKSTKSRMSAPGWCFSFTTRESLLATGLTRGSSESSTKRV